MLEKNRNGIEMNSPTVVTMGCMKCESGVQSTWALSYPFILTDAGRSTSRRPKQKNDCTVRAVATVLGLSYDEVYDQMAHAGRQCNRRFHLLDWLESRNHDEPGHFVCKTRRISFPAIKGKERMNLAEFCKQYPHGRYICRVAKHVFAVIDGVVYDTFENRCDRCVYLAWEILCR